MPLDPTVRRLIGAVSLAGPLAASSWSLAQRRDALRNLMRFSETGADVGHAVDAALPGPAGEVPIRIYTPRAAPGGLLPGLLYFHGGGLVAGDLDSHDALCRSLCSETGCRLIAVGYRLAPEHPYPAAVDDACAAARWVFAHASELGLDRRRIGIAGDSAGATLAAVVCQHTGRMPPVAPALQLLLCPILDWAHETASRRDFAHGYLLDRAMMQQDLVFYLAGQAPPDDPQVSPLLAPGLAGQPPSLIHTAEFDPLRDEGQAYADRLRAAGCAVGYHCHPGMVHLFYGLGRVVPYARAALARIGAEVRGALA